jgi:hypothetical protein
VPGPRQPYRFGPGEDSLQLSGLPKLADLIPAWHADAACKDEQDERVFFQEVSPFKVHSPAMMALPSLLLPLLICETCPVRRPCLEAAFNPPSFTTRFDEHHAVGGQESTPRVFGTWGATYEGDRILVADLPTEVAIDALESTLEARIAARLEAYWEARNRRAAQSRGPTRRDRRIDELLAKRTLKHSHLQGRRGKKGPYLLYAEAHGIRKATAWRRRDPGGGIRSPR